MIAVILYKRTEKFGFRGVKGIASNTCDVLFGDGHAPWGHFSVIKWLLINRVTN